MPVSIYPEHKITPRISDTNRFGTMQRSRFAHVDEPQWERADAERLQWNLPICRTKVKGGESVQTATRRTVTHRSDFGHWRGQRNQWSRQRRCRRSCQWNSLVVYMKLLPTLSIVQSIISCIFLPVSISHGSKDQDNTDVMA
jgi:hypothetical protein